jgi:hypothetical protein
LLNERAREISNKSDAPNRANLELGQNEVNSEWNGLIAELENRKETLTKLAEHWEVRLIQFKSLLQNLPRKTFNSPDI